MFEDDVHLDRITGHNEFSYNENYFKFDFVGTNPSAPNEIMYRYRLSRIDRHWVEAKQKLVQYTALPHGDYTFEVKARNEWGYWSEPATVQFTITPPFWKTWWFIALVIIASGGLIAIVVMNRVRHLLAIERIRTRIAADLHDDIGAALTEISIVSEVAGQKLPEEMQDSVAKELQHISAASRHIINSMSDIVWLVNPRRDSLHDLIARLGDTYNETLRQAGIALKIQNLASLKNVRLGMERRQHIFLIFKEAINNALKHADCTEISFTVEAGGGFIRMLLCDNGNGFNSDSGSLGNGLCNMRERAQRARANLEIRSKPGAGTAIILTMKR